MVLSVVTRSQIWRLLMDTVKHISTTDNVNELYRWYHVPGSKCATKDTGNILSINYNMLSLLGPFICLSMLLPQN